MSFIFTMEDYKRVRLMMMIDPVIVVFRLTTSKALKFSSSATFSLLLHIFCTCSEKAEAKVQVEWSDSHSQEKSERQKASNLYNSFPHESD